MTGFNFTLTGNHEEVKTKIYDKHGVVVKVAPGMVVTPEFEVYCALQSKLPVVELVAEYPEEIQITSLGQKEGDKYIYKFRFSHLGENLITVHYGDDLICFLDFFVTEPLETLIKNGRVSLWTNNNIVILPNGIMDFIVFGIWRNPSYFHLTTWAICGRSLW